VGLSEGEKIMTLASFLRFDTIPACDRRTDRRTEGHVALATRVKNPTKDKKNAQMVILSISQVITDHKTNIHDLWWFKTVY